MVTLLYFAMVLAVLAILSLIFVQVEQDVGFGFSFKPLKIRIYAKTSMPKDTRATQPSTADLAAGATEAELEKTSKNNGQPAPSLTTVTNQTFADQTIQLDGHLFQDCAFKNCTLVYSGHNPASFVQCQFAAIKWEVNATAANMVQFLKTLYKDGGESGKQWVEGTVTEITRG